MNFNLEKSIEILRSTPAVIRSMLSGLSDDWIYADEGLETWSPYIVVGHLIHGEKTDWIPRMEIILAEAQDKIFVPFDRFAQFENSKGKSLADLLDEFEFLRQSNIDILEQRRITDDDLQKTGIHPVFGAATLAQLLATWVVHDLNHISQMVRVMAGQYRNETGPWREYLRIIQ